MTALVCFTMDNLSDAADLGRGKITMPRAPGNRPALEVGFPAMLELYKKYEIPITHFIEGWNGSAHPDEIQRLLSDGHELGMHGWQHEQWSELDDDRAYELAFVSTNVLEKASGIRPKAFRAPGGGSTAFTRKLLSNLGYHIDASLNPGAEDGGPVAQVTNQLWSTPYEWAAVDATHWLWEDFSPESVEGCWKKMLNLAAENNSYTTFIWHPHIMGIDPARRAVGERIIQFVMESDQFRVATLTELIEHYDKATPV